MSMNPRIAKLLQKKKEQEKMQSGGSSTYTPDERLLPKMKFGVDNIFKMSFKVLPDKDLDAEPVQSQYVHYVNHPTNGKPRRFPCIYKTFGEYCPVCGVGAGIHTKLKEHENYENLDKLVGRSPENYINIFVIESSDESLEGKQFVWKAPNAVTTYLENQIKDFEIDPFEFDSSPILLKVEKTGPINREYSINDDKKNAKKEFTDILDGFGLTLDVITTNLADLTEFVYSKEVALDKENIAKTKLSLQYMFKDIYEDVVEMNDEEKEEFYTTVLKKTGYKEENSVSKEAKPKSPKSPKSFNVSDDKIDESTFDFKEDSKENTTTDEEFDEEFDDGDDW